MTVDLGSQIRFRYGHISFVDIDHEITSTVILPIPLIKIRQLSRKHAYIILTPLNLLLNSKTGVYSGVTK